MFVFKVLKRECPSWLYNFPNIGSSRNASTRQNNNLQVVRYRTDLGSRSMMIRGPSRWNDLPQYVKECTGIKVFKKKLKEHFLNRSN